MIFPLGRGYVGGIFGYVGGIISTFGGVYLVAHPTLVPSGLTQLIPLVTRVVTCLLSRWDEPPSCVCCVDFLEEQGRLYPESQDGIQQ